MTEQDFTHSSTFRAEICSKSLDIRQAFCQIDQETLTSFSEHDDVVSYLLEDYTANSIESDEEWNDFSILNKNKTIFPFKFCFCDLHQTGNH